MPTPQAIRTLPAPRLSILKSRTPPVSPHNLYRDFNVGANGTILNNSGDDVSHSTFGNIARNNNLTAGSASVILNEVTSKNASSLKGFIEVNGQKADVVIANPNGITCSGCSFVNTNKAILTTGKVNMTDDGAIGSYVP